MQVSDNGSDIVKALEVCRRIYCADHAINIIVRNTLAVKYHLLVEKLIEATPAAEFIISEVNSWVRAVRKVWPKSASKQKDRILETLKVSNVASQSHILMLSGFLTQLGTVSYI